MKTLLLDQTRWDLCLDSNGNIAVASNPYSLAQDAASAIMLFSGELWYDTTKGVPYLTDVLGLRPPLQLVKSLLTSAALTVPETTEARCFITGFQHRVLSGQVQVTDRLGVFSTISFGRRPPSPSSRIAVWDSFSWDDGSVWA